MSIIVTGAAGFIGCNNTIALNKRGYTDILAVDNLTKADKFLNLSECQISDYMDKHDFIDLVRQGKMPRPEAVFHQGACSDTMATDGRYVMDNNYRYSSITGASGKRCLSFTRLPLPLTARAPRLLKM